jgi:hypothetical protein
MSDYEELQKLAMACRTENCADEDEQARNEREFLLSVDPEEVLDLIAELKSYQQGAKAEADAGDEARAEVRKLIAENEQSSTQN